MCPLAGALLTNKNSIQSLTSTLIANPLRKLTFLSLTEFILFGSNFLSTLTVNFHNLMLSYVITFAAQLFNIHI